QFVDEQLVEPGLVDFQVGIGEQAIAVEALDVVALVRAAVAPDVDAVFFHGGHQHGAGDGAADGRGIEVRDAGGGNVEGAGLQGRDAFSHQLRPAVDQARVLGAVFHGAARDGVVVVFVGLAQVGGVGVGNGALVAHPEQRGAGIQAARKSNADLLADGKVGKNSGHCVI